MWRLGTRERHTCNQSVGGHSDVGEAHEREFIPNFFKPALDGGAQPIRHHTTVQSACDINQCIVKNQPAVPRSRAGSSTGGKDTLDTAAGVAVEKELKEYMRRHKAKPKAFQEEMGQTLKDKEVGKDLEVVVRELQPPEFLLQFPHLHLSLPPILLYPPLFLSVVWFHTI